MSVLEKEGSLLLKSVAFKHFLAVSIPSSVKLLFIDHWWHPECVKCHCHYWLNMVMAFLINQPFIEYDRNVFQSFMYLWSKVVFKWTCATCVWNVRSNCHWRGKYPVCSWKCLFFFATVEINYFVPFGFGKLKIGTQVQLIPWLQAGIGGSRKEITLTANSLESSMLM